MVILDTLGSLARLRVHQVLLGLGLLACPSLVLLRQASVSQEEPNSLELIPMQLLVRLVKRNGVQTPVPSTPRTTGAVRFLNAVALHMLTISLGYYGQAGQQGADVQMQGQQ